MLIVLEGLDGAGKSTQVKKLKAYLEQKRPPLEYIHFPRYGAPVYGDLISRFLRGEFGSNQAVHPQLVALLFAEDRHGAAPAIKKALSEGKTVLLDRYVYSNIAYQCSKLKSEKEKLSLRDWIFNTEYGDFGLPRPDINIFLDVPISFVKENLEDSRASDIGREYLEGARDIHEADINFQKGVREMYLGETVRDSHFERIDCSDDTGHMLPPEQIFAKIVNCLESVL